MLQVYKLFSNCIPVKGYNRSMIIDLQRQKFDFIPNSLYEILTEYSYVNFEKLKTDYSEHIEIIDQYFNLLLENEYIFETDTVESTHFPPINTEYRSPYQITNAVIDIDKNSKYKLTNIQKSFEKLGIIALQIRCYDFNSLKIKEILELFNDDSRLRFIELYIPFCENINFICKELLEKYERIYQVIVFNTPLLNQFENQNVIFTPKRIDNCTSCGVIEKNFIINLENYRYHPTKVCLKKYYKIKKCLEKVRNLYSKI